MKPFHAAPEIHELKPARNTLFMPTYARTHQILVIVLTAQSLELNRPEF